MSEFQLQNKGLVLLLTYPNHLWIIPKYTGLMGERCSELQFTDECGNFYTGYEVLPEHLLKVVSEMLVKM